MRVIDTVSGLVQLTGRGRRSAEPDAEPLVRGAIGQLETRLAGVVVAALKEAFDRDRARLDLERAQMDAERQRAEDALRAELRRQASERALSQVRLVAIMALTTWMLSAALLVVLPGMHGTPRVLMGFGWAFALAALGAAFAAWQRVSTWSVDLRAPTAEPSNAAAAAAPWLLLLGVALTGAALLAAGVRS